MCLRPNQTSTTSNGPYQDGEPERRQEGYIPNNDSLPKRRSLPQQHLVARYDYGPYLNSVAAGSWKLYRYHAKPWIGRQESML